MTLKFECGKCGAALEVGIMGDLPGEASIGVAPCQGCVETADTQLIRDLIRCVDDLMPGAKHCAFDIGHLNDTLIAGRKRAQE